MMFAGLVLPILAAGTALAQWPQFRGPNGAGVDTTVGYPAEFSPRKNVVWKTAVPYGQSSPVVAAGHVYLTASDAGRLMTICLDQKTGRELWRREIRRDRVATIFHANDPASPTPAADENGVVVFFAEFGLAAYGPDGTDRWTRPLGPFTNFYGMAASPIIADDALIMVCDQQRGGFVLSLDRKTGREKWRTARAGADIGWATPMVFRPASGAPQLIVLGSFRLDGYTLETGAARWWMPIVSGGALGTAIANGDSLLVSTAGSTEPSMPTFEAVLQQYDKNRDGRLSHDEFKDDKDLGEHFGWIDGDSDGVVTAEEWNLARRLGVGEFGAIALRPATASGKLEPSAATWRVKKNLPYIPAPLLYRGVFYMVKDGGIVTSLDPETGRLLKQGRSPEALGEYYASPVAADGKVFLASGDGKVTVLKAGAEWDVLQVNDLGEEIHATPALAGGRIYIRTRSAVYCFSR
jgi:outer membrane protein assembly factor BamB